MYDIHLIRFILPASLDKQFTRSFEERTFEPRHLISLTSSEADPEIMQILAKFYAGSSIAKIASKAGLGGSNACSCALALASSTLMVLSVYCKLLVTWVM